MPSRRWHYCLQNEWKLKKWNLCVKTAISMAFCHCEGLDRFPVIHCGKNIWYNYGKTSGFGHIDISYAAVTYNWQNSPALGCVSLEVAVVLDMMLGVAVVGCLPAAVFKLMLLPSILLYYWIKSFVSFYYRWSSTINKVFNFRCLFTYRTAISLFR